MYSRDRLKLDRNGAKTDVETKLTVFPANVRKKSSTPRLAEAEALMTSSLVGRRLTSQ